MFLFVKRYLLAKKSHSVVNIITTLSLVAISLPVAAIIILLSVFNGFGILIDQTNRVVDPDLMVVASSGSHFVIDSLDREAILRLEGVESLAVVSEQTMLFESGGSQVVGTLRGVDSAYLSVVPLDKAMRRGQFQPTFGDLDRIVLGNAMAYRLGATNLIESYIDIYALKGSGFSSLLPMSNYTQRRLKVAGIYMADVQSEDRYALTSLRAVQRLTSTEGKATQLFVGLEPSASQSRLKGLLTELLGPQFEVKSRYDLNPMIYDIVKYEKWGVLFVSALIMLIASFSLLGALSILIIEKRADIATLRAMGGSWRFVRGIFFGEGLFISSLGVALGTALGVVLTLCQEQFGWVKIPAQTFVSNFYPVELQFGDVAIVIIISLSISALLSKVIVGQMIKNE